jgi:hypothetical protein
MSEHTAHTTARPRTDPGPSANGTWPTPVALAPARRRIATFTDYGEAERAVEKLTNRGFPVERLAIVGRGLQSVEQITGAVNWWSAAWHGALSGALPGVLIGWIFGLFSWVNPLIASLLLALYGLIIGVVLGAVTGVIGYAFMRGRRDFSSITLTSANEFDLVADDSVADDAARLLAEEV